MTKKTIIVTIAVIATAGVLIAAGVFGISYLLSEKTTTNENTNQANQNTNISNLPSTPENSTSTELLNAEERQEFEKEKKFISSFYQAPKQLEINQSDQRFDYTLPLENIKEQIANYSDFSRRVSIENKLEVLSQNGFVVIENQFSDQAKSWQETYNLLKENSIPIYISADAVTDVYLTTLATVYKEIEQQIFYQSLWKVMSQLQAIAQERYDQKYRMYGIEGGIGTEAARLELAYFTVALKLLEPQANQVKQSLDPENPFFSPEEQQKYSVEIPSYLDNEVNSEISLIKSKPSRASSPIFKIEKNYSLYAIPEPYTVSEKLKNYYLAITWLNDVLFPLWNKDQCEACNYDEHDHLINFIASLHISTDLATDQSLQNEWANIYKTISFFEGLENNLTYLDYNQALSDTFGEDYELEEIFSTDTDVYKGYRALLQKNLSQNRFPLILGGNSGNQADDGLKLLRDNFLMEDYIFAELTAPNIGTYTGGIRASDIFTACSISRNQTRCYPTSLDLFSLNNSGIAKAILSNTENVAYEGYNDRIAKLTDEISKLTTETFRDNAPHGLLAALQKLPQSDFPAFAKTDAWQRKQLQSQLAAWTQTHLYPSINSIKPEGNTGLRAYFPYGFLEPAAPYYQELAAQTKMIYEGFAALRIISTESEPYLRLQKLEQLLNETIEISIKELQGDELGVPEYNFINDFPNRVEVVLGDVRLNTDTTKFSLTYSNSLSGQKTTNSVNGLEMMVIVYPTTENKLFFAAGPVWSFSETRSSGPRWSWQNIYR